MTEILRTRRLVLLAVCCAAVVGLAAGCGGSSSASGVPSGDIAVVNGQGVTKAQFDHALDQYNRSATAAQQQPIKCCGTDYDTVVQQKIVPYLVQRTEFEQQAKKLGVVVTSADIDKAVKSIVKQYFKGKMSGFLAAIKKQNSSISEVRDTIRLNVLQTKVTAKLTAGIKVTDKEARDLYEKNIANYSTPESRKVAHILVKTKKKADSIYAQLQNGASFATLAKKDSIDTSTKVNGGQLTICRGKYAVQHQCSTVHPFEVAAFALKTGGISKPVKSQFGWHVIKALGPVTPLTTSPFSAEKAAIVQQLLQAKKADATSKWQTKIERFYATRVKYASGYAPPSATSPGETALFPTAPVG